MPRVTQLVVTDPGIQTHRGSLLFKPVLSPKSEISFGLFIRKVDGAVGLSPFLINVFLN